jgi:uncharacterized protein YggE
MRLFTAIAPAVLAPLMLTVALAAPVMADDAIISLTGTGEVTAKPDMALITSGVVTQAATARDALTANTKAMADLLEVLKAAGVEERDVQTSGFSVSPNYVYSDQRDANGYSLPPQINGYSVSNNVTVRIRDLASLGTVLDKQVTVGANSINGVMFTVADPSALYDEARKEAFADAKHKAEIYAEAAGEELGLIKSVSEQQGYSVPQPYMMKVTARLEADAAPVPVAAGELSFQVNVNVTWTFAN